MHLYSLTDSSRFVRSVLGGRVSLILYWTAPQWQEPGYAAVVIMRVIEHLTGGEEGWRAEFATVDAIEDCRVEGVPNVEEY